MALTPEQLAALKADMLADPVFAAVPHTPDGADSIAVAYNQEALPAYWVWRTTVMVPDLMKGGFDWTRVDNLTVGKARIWQFMTSVNVVDPSLASVRAGFEATFNVEASDALCRQAIYDGSVRRATRAEKLYATGTGAAPNHHGIGPATMTWEGRVTYTDVQCAWAVI